MRLGRTAVLIALVSIAASVYEAGALAERGAGRQRTYANLVGPLVARAHSSVTLRGWITHVSARNVVIQSSPGATANWRTLARLGLKSDGTFVFKTRVGATGTQGRSRTVFYRVVFAGDATHLPSGQSCMIEVV